jgi:hypothetical protein
VGLSTEKINNHANGGDALRQSSAASQLCPPMEVINSNNDQGNQIPKNKNQKQDLLRPSSEMKQANTQQQTKEHCFGKQCPTKYPTNTPRL